MIVSLIDLQAACKNRELVYLRCHVQALSGREGAALQGWQPCAISADLLWAAFAECAAQIPHANAGIGIKEAEKAAAP